MLGSLRTQHVVRPKGWCLGSGVSDRRFVEIVAGLGAEVETEHFSSWNLMNLGLGWVGLGWGGHGRGAGAAAVLGFGFVEILKGLGAGKVLTET